LPTFFILAGVLVKVSPVVVKVDLPGKAYEIFVQPGSLEKLIWPTTLENRYSRAIVISDENVAKLYLAKFKRQLKKIIPNVDSAVCMAGEQAKSPEIANSLWQRLFSFGADRQSLVVALGGGVVGDLAGFVASTYMRGIDFVQIPTTLLAQVDSSVGGKVGINLQQGKNLIGAFWQPRAVLIDPLVLMSLSDREYRSGLAEVVKYGAALDRDFFEFLERNILQIMAREPIVMQQIIARCCEIKAAVVMEDERETSGRRALLNFGHTYGHAIEMLTGYSKILHGEAVAIGMGCAGRLAVELGMWPVESATRVQDLLMILGLPTVLPKIPHDKMLATMQMDKKRADSVVQLVLPTQLGAAKLVPWPGDDAITASFVSPAKSKPSK
jgi:3-dehydroquinate synthase